MSNQLSDAGSTSDPDSPSRQDEQAGDQSVNALPAPAPFGSVFVAGDDGLVPIPDANPVVVVSRSLPAGSYAVIATITVIGSAPEGSQGEFGGALSATNGATSRGAFTTPGSFGSAQVTFQLAVSLGAPGAVSLSCWATPPTYGGDVGDRQLMAIQVAGIER